MAIAKDTGLVRYDSQYWRLLASDYDDDYGPLLSRKDLVDLRAAIDEALNETPVPASARDPDVERNVRLDEHIQRIRSLEANVLDHEKLLGLVVECWRLWNDRRADRSREEFVAWSHQMGDAVNALLAEADRKRGGE